MNILFITHYLPNTDGRTISLLNICKKIGTVSVLSPGKVNNNDFQMKGRTACKQAMQIIREKNIDLIFIDNRLACIEGNYIKLLYPQIYIIQDARELYTISLKRSLKSNIGCLLEQHLMKKADIVISANTFRAEYMWKHFHINKKPISYENIRKIECSSPINASYSKKYSFIFEKQLPIVISTSGYQVCRRNDQLVRDFKAIDDHFVLLMVGTGTKKDKKYVCDIIKKYKVKNVFLIGKVDFDELYYLISVSTIGIVNYGNYDLNNEYCASGKIYEFVYQHVPVVTTKNPPLLEMCDNFRIGYSCEDFSEGIEKVYKNLDYYKCQITNFLQIDWIHKNEEEFTDKIKKEIKKCGFKQSS